METVMYLCFGLSIAIWTMAGMLFFESVRNEPMWKMILIGILCGAGVWLEMVFGVIGWWRGR